MKLKDFEIFNKFYNTMETVIGQFDEVTQKDLDEIKRLELQNNI